MNNIDIIELININFQWFIRKYSRFIENVINKINELQSYLINKINDVSEKLYDLSNAVIDLSENVYDLSGNVKEIKDKNDAQGVTILGHSLQIQANSNTIAAMGTASAPFARHALRIAACAASAPSHPLCTQAKR